MPWDKSLLPNQRLAASHIGSSACLLAGPGTGKTLTLVRRVCFLIEEKNILPDSICVLTFTRAAARELQRRIEAEVGVDKVPNIATLHSFALRQLLRNSDKLISLPQPLRIADDWEERHIILEDLKTLLNFERIDRAQKLLNELSADWRKLTSEESDWGQRFPDPAFLGAWREHRAIYGYILRAELVYRLKHAIEQYDDLSIEGPPEHLLVDEYQDLNLCDLSVVKAIGDRGAEIFVAGDDDQSIYGFREAHPTGIRLFPNYYHDACRLTLEICKRCDREILELGLFIANQDYNRIKKPLRAEDGRDGAKIALLRFNDQFQEAHGAALLCQYLINHQGLNPDGILVLLRTDRNGVFSSVLRQKFEQYGIPVCVDTEDANPLNKNIGRIVLSFLRLLVNEKDHLSWRTLFKNRNNRIGSGAIAAIYELARQRGLTFIETLSTISQNPHLISSQYGRLIKDEVETIKGLLQDLSSIFTPKNGECVDFGGAINCLLDHIVESDEELEVIQHHLGSILNEAQPLTVEELIYAINLSEKDIEQEIEKNKVNILTMHKAKGLTADAVIIVAAEDEYLPGPAIGEMVGDERRLLYVSLTRAKHYLFITYCNRRTGRQRYTGRTSGQVRRSLSRFLEDAPAPSHLGTGYIQNLQARQT